MIEQDTIRLLRECDAGVKMGIDSIDDVLEYVNSEEFKKHLVHCKDGHIRLDEKIRALLKEYHDEGKEPNPMAKSMSWLKTNVRLVMRESDQTIAGLMTDGCNMGVKSLSKYLNQYKAADEKSREIAEKLIKLEEEFVGQIRGFL